MRRTMMETVIGLVLVLVVAVQLSSSFASSALQSTVPAFLWSPYYQGDANNVKEVVNYRTLSQKDLAKSILSKGGWSNLLCSGKDAQQSTDLALIFVGQELQSSEISRPRKADPVLVDLLKASFAKANFSLAFPYVAASDEEAIESSLISEISHTCGHDLEMGNIAFSDTCSLNGDHFEKLANIHAVHDYLISRLEKGSKGQANVIVFCHGDSGSLKPDQQQSESRVFSELISSVEQLNAKYSVLYVSDPFKSIQYPSYRELGRFLAEGAPGDKSANSAICDEVCQIKSSLLEGILVVSPSLENSNLLSTWKASYEGIVLLLILISGLCCMMGIDTPTRFESPQES